MGKKLPHAMKQKNHTNTEILIQSNLHPNPIDSAKQAGLRYIPDTAPGIQRIKAENGFDYVKPDGSMVEDANEIARIKKLAIPPAYEDVWICPQPNGYLQATGRDAKGRKQYRYHPKWRDVRDETKYSRMMAFAEALPKIRRRVDHDLRLPGLPREKVLATVVRLLETTMIRVGNDEYAKTNHSYGLTTLRNKHVNVEGSVVHFHFRGNSGKTHCIDLQDRKLANIVKRCRELPGYDLFQYLDKDGIRQSIGSSDVNEYLREISGDDFTAKDFCTWAGTILTALALQELEACENEVQAKKNVVRAIESVAERLGNTPSICRKCYVHPAVIESYLGGALLESLQQVTDADLTECLRELKAEEAAVVAMLRGRVV
jgi:DNA topoisomerase-1